MNVKSYVLLLGNLGVAISLLFMFVLMSLNGGQLLIYEYNTVILVSEIVLLTAIIILDVVTIAYNTVIK